MPPIEHAIINGCLYWRYLSGHGKWRVCTPAVLTSEINSLRRQLGLGEYPVLEDAESLPPGE